MKSILATVLFISCVVLSSAAKPKKLKPAVKEIEKDKAGGLEAKPHEFPFQVALINSNQEFCGGSLIHPEWILSAAHCFQTEISGSGVQILLGVHNMSSASEPNRVSLNSTKVIIHESYDGIYKKNDIALIEIVPPPGLIKPGLDLQSNCIIKFHLSSPAGVIDIIKLPEEEENPPSGTMVTMTGWGDVADGVMGLNPVLKKVERPVMSSHECGLGFKDMEIVYDGLICTTSKGNAGVCKGDSGGPVIWNDSGLLKLTGITSFGSSVGCEVGLPHASTKVSFFRPWIKKHSGV